MVEEDRGCRPEEHRVEVDQIGLKWGLYQRGGTESGLPAREGHGGIAFSVDGRTVRGTSRGSAWKETICCLPGAGDTVRPVCRGEGYRTFFVTGGRAGPASNCGRRHAVGRRPDGDQTIGKLSGCRRHGGFCSRRNYMSARWRSGWVISMRTILRKPSGRNLASYPVRYGNEI